MCAMYCNHLIIQFVCFLLAKTENIYRHEANTNRLGITATAVTDKNHEVVWRKWEETRNYTGAFDCEAIIAGDSAAIPNAISYCRSHSRKAISDSDFIKLTKNCTEFKTRREYILEPLSKEEANFSVAFSILFYKELEQVELLLRNIYRPNNYYCLHVDAGAPTVCTE